HHLDALLEAVFQDLRDLFGGVGQHHDHRWLSVRHQAIGLIGQHFGRAADHALAWHDRAQRGNNGVTPVQDRLIGSRHHDGHRYPSRPRFIELSRQIKHVYRTLGRPSEGWIAALYAILQTMSSLWDKSATMKPVKVSWLVQPWRYCHKRSLSGKK